MKKIISVLFPLLLLSGVVFSQQVTIEQQNGKTYVILETQNIQCEKIRFIFSTGLWLTCWNQYDTIAEELELKKGTYSVEIIDPNSKSLIAQKEFEVK